VKPSEREQTIFFDCFKEVVVKLKLVMKKKFLIVGLVSVCCLGAFLVSCDKDEPSQKCTCTEQDGAGYSESQELDPASYGATNCSDLAVKLKMAAGVDSDYYYSCR
jgi:hypothetical protein